MRTTHAMLSTAIVIGTLLPLAARAQVPDHLKCYKVKDPSAKATYTADLGGLTPEPGCVVKVPAKLFCVESTKTNVQPTPPGAPDGPAAGHFVCYQVKCPKGAVSGVAVTDQFGSRILTPSAAQILCAPAQVPGSTTSTTTSTSSTTIAGPTTTSSSTTSTTVPSGLCCPFIEGCGSYVLGGCPGGSAGPPGSVCNGTTGVCTIPPLSAGPCCDVQGAACIGGPGVNPVSCANHPGSVYHASAVCLTTGHCQ